VHRGLDEVSSDVANNQISIIPAGASRVYKHRLSDFRLVPKLTAESLSRFSISDNALRQSIVLERGGRKCYEFDKGTGVLRYAGRYGDDGTLLRERFQLGLREFSGVRCFPAITLDIRYVDGKPEIAMVFISIQYVFNDVIAPNEYDVQAAAKSMNVFDYRSVHDNRPAHFVISPDDGEVLKVANERAEVRPAPASVGGDERPRYVREN
jgi:hypothetical protein